MATFADRQRINREANRPAIKFNQRDDMRDFARSAHGQNYNRMMDIQRQLPNMDRNDPMVQEFKDRRRTLNRYGKYPMGEMLGMSPQEMQDKTGLRDVRQTNKPVYNKMYPLTGGFMDYVQGGGLPGLILKGAGNLLGNLSGMGRDILGGDGINGADRDVSQKELGDYAAKTFGFYPSDVHPGLPIEDETSLVDEKTREEKIQGLKDEIQEKIDNFENPFPLLPTQEDIDDAEQDRIDDYYGKSEQGEMVFADVPDDIEPLPFDQGREDFIRGQNEYAPPVIPEPDPQGDFANFNKYAIPNIDIEFGPYEAEGQVPPSIIPFDDSVREAGIASLYGQGPQWAETNRRYEDEYRDHIARTGERMTYEEFARAWENVHQGKPHKGEIYQSAYGNR